MPDPREGQSVCSLEDLYMALEGAVGDAGSVDIRRVWKPSELPWSCDVIAHDGRAGYGVGTTMRGSIEDALTDLETDVGT